ncbi:MAG: ABC transporter permease [Candidatus Eisenbacteria bacterium]
MRRIFVIAANDWRLALRDRQAMLWMFLMPLLFIFVFGNLGGGGGERKKRDLPVLVEDERFLGAAVFDALEDETWAPLCVSRDDSLFANLTLWIEVPAGFTDSVLAGEGSTIRIMEKEGASAQTREGYAMNARMAGIRVLTNLFAFPDSALALLPDEEIRPIYDSLAGLPEAVILESRLAEGARELPDGYLLSVPGNLIMFVLIVALTGGAATVAAEAGRGHLRRLGASPAARHEVFLGKLFGSALIALTQIAFLLAASVLLFRIDWGNDPVGLGLVLLLFALTAASIGVFLGLLVRKPETAAAAGVLTTLVMASLGGCWWPLELVSDTMRTVGHLFPTAWALGALFDLAAYGKTTAEIAPKLFMLLAYATFFSVLGSRLLRFDR